MAGLLSDVLPAVYSASNVMKNKLRGLLDDPLGTLQQVVGDANDRARSFNQLGDRSAAETLASVKAGKGLGNGPASNALLGKIADAYNPVAMTVWHGSPHQFSKFDASKIGTGEGAQAYGHGLYLAENPGVAQEYKTALAGVKLRDGSIVKPDWTDPTFMPIAELRKSNGDVAKARAAVLKKSENWPEQVAAFDDLVNRGVSLDNGQLYKVDLPDDQIAKMLDWDKPLSQQAPGVQAAIKNEPGFNWDKVWSDFQGVNAYDVLANGRHGNPVGNVAAAEKLQQAGIPGIRYLDGGSRGAGAGSSNFVVFPGNEDMLTILERNGQPVNALRGLLDR